MTISRRMLFLVCLYLLCCAAFMTVNARGSWDFIIPFRGVKLLGISLVAIAVSVSTVLFQTLTRNRILTPSIMGFDALYVLLQTMLVFVLGGMGFAQLPQNLLFGVSFLIMMVASLMLFATLFATEQGGGGQDLHRLLLTGIIFGVLFRSVSSFIMRVIDPNEFVVAATSSIAQFSKLNSELLSFSAVLVGLVLVVVWRMRHAFDVMLLGRDVAINLGVDYRRQLYITLGLVACLVSVSTALVGPIAFFGLLVSNLTYQVFPTHRHAVLLPAVSLFSACFLLAGQVVLEQVLSFSVPLSVIIEFLGGAVFLLLVLRGAKR